MHNEVRRSVRAGRSDEKKIAIKAEVFMGEVSVANFYPIIFNHIETVGNGCL